MKTLTLLTLGILLSSCAPKTTFDTPYVPLQIDHCYASKVPGITLKILSARVDVTGVKYTFMDSQGGHFQKVCPNGCQGIPANCDNFN